MRLIDADALGIGKANPAMFENKCYADGWNSAIEILEQAPTVDAEPVRHGRWVNPHMNKYGHPCHHCSECGFLASQKDRNFCPNCGAKMDAKEE